MTYNHVARKATQQKSTDSIQRNLSSTFFYSCLLSVVLFSSCNQKKETVKHSEKVKNTVVDYQPKQEIKYHLDSIANKKALDSFNAKYDSAQTMIILALNRLSPGRIRVGTKLILPDTLLTNLMEYTPFPSELKVYDTTPKLIVINQRIQAFGAYENGKLQRWGPTSTGRKDKPTPAGLQYTNYKARLKISTIDGDWKMPWYFNIQNRSGIGMHQFVMPGYPASHSCIRLLEQDAIWIYNWADQWQLNKNGTVVEKRGTPVIIFGSYAFGQTPPWKLLQSDANATRLTDEEIAAINGFEPSIKK